MILASGVRGPGFNSRTSPNLCLKNFVETPGIEPGASRMRIERSTTELHPHEYIWASFRQLARLAEWSKAQDLSSCNRKIAWVRTPHLARWVFFNWLQWRNRLAHGTYRQYTTRYAGVVSSSLTWSIKFCPSQNGGSWTKNISQPVGFEPTLPEGNWFRVSRLNHSATTAVPCWHWLKWVLCLESPGSSVGRALGF